MNAMNLIQRVPKPMLGMNWEPSPSDYKSLPAPEKYGDTDFANDDFVALWSADDKNVGRCDLITMYQGLGANTIKMYNWSVPAPKGYWRRNHKKFLVQCQNEYLGVIVPISNFFTGTAYNNRTNNNNPGGPFSNLDLKSWIQQIVAEIYSNGDPGPVVMWAIGNEYDNSNCGAFGYCEAQDVAQIAKYIIDAEEELNITAENCLAMSSPVTTATKPINNSIPCVSPTGMGVCATVALQNAFVNSLGKSVAKERFVASVNSYQIGPQLTDYYNKYPSYFSETWIAPFYYGELGFSAAGKDGPATQAKNIYNQFTTIIPQAKNSDYFLGACAFEWSDELWKASSGESERMFGIQTFPDKLPTQFSNETSSSRSPNAKYPVDDLTPRQAYYCLQAAMQNAPPEWVPMTMLSTQ